MLKVYGIKYTKMKKTESCSLLAFNLDGDNMYINNKNKKA